MRPITVTRRPAAKYVIWLQAAALVGTLSLSRCLPSLFPLQLSSILFVPNLQLCMPYEYLISLS
ncbi:uncharacterized protein TrAtP1_011392 [Trichoderma atroviride]|uniref:uncharacterized protein n=1 Tax=Hypocrea atroviridis TaxID=63577 RepID=UPI00332078FA|nr:hypothetical protein TrAtP1_011392 [Trichoderma atroviride]